MSLEKYKSEAKNRIMEVDLKCLCPDWLYCPEVQAIILAGLCCVGAWVILSWLIQLMFSILWPFFVVVAVMIAMPTWRKILATEILPNNLNILRNMMSQLGLSFT